VAVLAAEVSALADDTPKAAAALADRNLKLLALDSDNNTDQPEAEAPPGYEDAGTARDAPREAPLQAGLAAGEAIMLDAVAPHEDQRVVALEGQYLPQFQNLVKAEFSLLARVCQLSPEQRRQLAPEKERCTKSAARVYALGQLRMQSGGYARGPMEPRRLVQEEVAKVLREKLTADQLAAYEKELAQRAAGRKRAAVLNLVARLDGQLMLSVEQRAELTERLSDNWQESWVPSMESFLYDQGIQYLPDIPERHIVPVLTDWQRQVWQRKTKFNQVIWGIGFGFTQMAVDDFDVDGAAATPP